MEEEDGDGNVLVINEDSDYNESDEDDQVDSNSDVSGYQHLESESVSPLSEDEVDVMTCTHWDDLWIAKNILKLQAEDEKNSENDSSDNESVDESTEIKTNELKRQLDDPLSINDITPPKKTIKLDLDDSEKICAPVNEKARNLMINSSVGFSALIHAFKYLRVYELLRAARVCKMWNYIASHPSFWHTVIMKNSMVHNWKGFVRHISTMGTKHLSLKKMIGPRTEESIITMWENFSSAISSSSNSLISIDMWRCTPKAFFALAEASPQLESLISTAIKADEIDLLPLKNNLALKELKMKPFKGSLTIKDFSFLTPLINLTSLGLTSIKNLNEIAVYLPKNLETLELGECSGLSNEVLKNLSKLVKLRRLRLEKGWDNCPTTAILEVISSLPMLYHLELINFEIRPGFDWALAKCTNIRLLLIIPTYFTQKATTNTVLIRGLSHLKETLKSLIWVMTLELLRTIDLLLEDMENNKSWRKGSIPPKEERVPLYCTPIIKRSKKGSNQVHIIHFNELNVIFSYLLPNTRIQIRRIPYECTWAQTFYKNDRR